MHSLMASASTSPTTLMMLYSWPHSGWRLTRWVTLDSRFRVTPWTHALLRPLHPDTQPLSIKSPRFFIDWQCMLTAQTNSYRPSLSRVRSAYTLFTPFTEVCGKYVTKEDVLNGIVVKCIAVNCITVICIAVNCVVVNYSSFPTYIQIP